MAVNGSNRHSTSVDGEVMQIDLGALVRAKTGLQRVPRWVVALLERIVCVDRLNAVLRDIGERRGADAAQTALESLRVGVDVVGGDRLPADGQGRFLFVSNHPLGGLDGLALIALLGHRYPRGFRFLVNDLLMAVRPLADVFLPVNKHGAQSRAAAEAIAAAAAGDGQLATFPAGLCSRRQADGTVADLPWHKWVVRTAVDHRRDVVPIYVDARNSGFFYRVAQWRKRLGIKFNAEMVLLPREMLRQQGGSVRLVVGRTVPCGELAAEGSADTALECLRNAVYSLATPA